ncbi:ferric reductase like transmembrane component-domain-containing protein [Dioszegia hungarica]|uniref:ferric-chelate reductase (NADPH) n=1 Tax=Dioszegia hungarica TaxID=4972 RepID=A0AA38H777_9TREE|nr:ferric reductase like transmembrane component-domain-containing protein [Dioszegia hungarica]KAI9635137.1 ferric reductase like transmembrane component-domain-containing protein [Dioszegia hungarica]
MSSISPRHIQDFNDAAGLEPHWGYADRVIPCTSDAGSCEYLDIVYWAHDVGMLYMGAMWAVIIGGLMVWGFLYRTRVSQSRLGATISSFTTRHFLPELRPLRFLFGRTTRLQIAALALIITYLSVFSFAGIVYKSWITPVKNMPGVYNTRSSLGPWSDRIGVIAYALTPVSILLVMRESLLSVITGVPYQHFNFLHRWTGHIILLQSVLHTIGWCLVEIRFYQPQPSVAVTWIKQTYMIWGVVALIFLLLLWGLATRTAQRAFGYEFFRKAHYVLAMLYIGAIYAHWSALGCFLIPSILLWGIDRAIRLGRTALIHYHLLPDGRGVFSSLPSKITHYGEDILRIDLINPNPTSWAIGQHFYLTFPQSSIWQSHPFTPLSLPGPRHSYLIRAKRGETQKVTAFQGDSTPVILTGPYGADIMRGVSGTSNILCVAGGTGITFVLPVLMQLAQRGEGEGILHLVWAVRRKEDEEWIAPELEFLRRSPRVRVTVYSTRSPPSTPASAETPGPSEKNACFDRSDSSSSSAEKGSNMPTLDHSARPDIHQITRDFAAQAAGGEIKVYVSGPSGMITAAREVVADLNDPRGVWRGERKPVEMIYDDRLE